ncbi:protein PFC0760c-like [Planococcus citri]|uniref:protein PFC0760c-like n=1 Tax=Planococcus citri TaxID=170843 RepID=UPI0031F871CA
MRPILKTIGESMIRPVCASICEKDYDSSPPSLSFPSRDGGEMKDVFKQIARELMTRLKQGSIFKQRSVRPAFLRVAPEAPEFRDVSLKSSSFDCSDTEITTLIELPRWQRGSRYSRGSLGSVHDFSSDPTTEDEEEDPTSPEKDYEKSSSFLSLSSYIGHEFENPEESNEMNSSTTKTNVSDDTSFDEITVICKQKNDDDAPQTEFNDADEIDDFDDTSLSSALMQDEDEDDGYDDGVADVEWNTYESLNDVDEDYFAHENGAAKPTIDHECVTSFIEKAPLTIGARYKPELAVIYEESHISDSKCSLKSILEDSATIFVQPQGELIDSIAIAAQPEFERSDTPDTYVIEDESSRADHLDTDVWNSLEKCIACADILLEHVKNAKINRNDSETVSSPMANFAASDVNGTGVDSDAHTISESSLISCLADSTEYLEALKNDSCSLDANDESDEIVLDSGILMEDVITCSSEGDYTDMKLHSEVVSTEIGPIVVPFDGRASSGSEEAEDAVWVTQIEKIFDFEVDDFCLNTLFDQSDESAAYHEDTELPDLSVEEEVTDFGLVYDSEPSNRRFSDLDSDHYADSVIQNDECSFDSVIDSDDQSLHDHLINDEISPALYTFRYDAESMSTRVDHMDHEHLDSIRASVLVNKPDSDSNHLSDNYINAGVTSNVPESVIAHCDDDTQPIPASTAVETETSSTPTSEHNLELNVSHRSQANGEVCEFIEQPNVAVDSEVTESPPKKTDFDSVIIRTSDAEYQLPCDVSEAFIGFKKVSEVFGESFLNDANNNEDSSHDPETEQDILCNDLPDVEKTSPRDEFKTDNNMDDDSSYVCKDSNLIVAAADETAKLSIADIPELTAEFEEEEEETPCKITTDNSIVKDAPCEDDIRAPEAEKDDRSVIESANFSNVAIVVDDHTEITESAIKTFENVAHQEAESDSEEVLASQQLEYEVELDADITGEENNNRISVDDANFLENHETVADVEAADNEVVCELEASAESSENNDDVTVVEMTMHNSIESSGKISENGSSPERSESVEFPEVDDCDMEVENDDVASESPESVRSPENDDIASESPGSVESSENDDVASESSESAEDDDVVSKLSESDKLSENDDVVSESSESIESSENDDAVSDSSESIESFENNHDIVVAENDEAASESSESAHLETENSGDDVTTMDKDAIPLPSECVEPSQCNDAFVATAIVENDSIPDLFEFFKVTENSDDEDIVKNNVNAEFAENIDDDDDVAANQLVELGESPESSDDIAIIENNPVHESSESAESTDMIDDAVAVQNGVICQSSEIVESTDENSDGVVESDNIGFPDVYESMVEHVGDVPVQSDAIDQPPEMADLAENDDNDVSIVENDVIFESPESDKLVETAESATIIDNTVAMQNLIGENSEIVESTRNNDDVSESEDIIVPDLSESIVKNVDDVLAQSDAIDQPSEMVNSPENGDNDVSIVVNNICELSESGEFVETVDNVVTVQNNDTSDDPPASVVEFSETIADVVELTDTTVENQSSSVIENIDEVSIPHYDLDQSSELDKSTGNILKSLETDESIETIDDVSNQPLESVVESPESNNDVKSDDIVIKDSSKWTAEDVENRSIENDSVFESSECVEVAENIGEVVSLQNDIVCEPEENIDDVSIPHYDLDQSSELDKSTGNILKSLETDESIETTDDVSNQPPPEWMAENVENRSIENDAVSESSESVEMAEKISEIASVENYIVYEPEETIEADELFDSNSDHFAAVENDVIQELTESTNNVDDQSTKNINIIENDPIHELSNGSSEKSEEVQTIENEAIAESCDNNDSAIIENNIDPTQSTESNTNATDAIDNNHPAFEPAFVRNKHLIAVSNQSISYSIGCDTNAEICSLLGYLNEKKIFVKNIAANNNNTANAISADTANSNVKEEVADTAVANSSNEMLDENYVTISDASSSKPEEDRERESSSSSQIDQSFVTISEASIDKSESSISLTPEHKTKPRYSPEQRKSRNNVKTRVQFTNRRSVKRTSSSQKKESTDEDDSSKRNNATSSSGSNNGAGDEKKPKLEPLDVTEYSVKLKLHIEWDNKRSSSDSTSKSSSFDDSLNCSESTSEGKRDFREENKTNADAKDNGQPYYHHRFEQVTRLLTDFKNDYPKFVSYEYFSPKIKFQTTPRKKQTSRNTARKSLSLDSSPSGRYHRYCHISTRDLNNVDSKCTTFNAVVTPKRNVSSPTVKNVNQTTNISKKRVNRKLLKSRNQINTNSSLKTSTPVLTAAQFVNQESIIENLTSNTLSPIVNSLEEFELIESLLSSCET